MEIPQLTEKSAGLRGQRGSASPSSEEHEFSTDKLLVNKSYNVTFTFETLYRPSSHIRRAHIIKKLSVIHVKVQIIMKTSGATSE